MSSAHGKESLQLWFQPTLAKHEASSLGRKGWGSKPDFWVRPAFEQPGGAGWGASDTSFVTGGGGERTWLALAVSADSPQCSLLAQVTRVRAVLMRELMVVRVFGEMDAAGRKRKAEAWRRLLILCSTGRRGQGRRALPPPRR